jgi:hypothetical protein
MNLFVDRGIEHPKPEPCRNLCVYRRRCFPSCSQTFKTRRYIPSSILFGSVAKSCGRQKLTGWAASYRQAQRSGQRDVEFAQLIGTKVSDEVG